LHEIYLICTPSGGTHGEERKVYKVLVGMPEGKDHLEDRSVDGIRMDLREIGWGGGSVEWIRLVQDRGQWRALVNAVMNLWVLASRSWYVISE
jgi:hypothetical protein